MWRKQAEQLMKDLENGQCNDPRLAALVSAGGKITHTASRPEAPAPEFKEALRARLEEDRIAATRMSGFQRLLERLAQWIEPKRFIPATAVGGVLAILISVATFLTGGFSGGSHIPVVEAGADFVSVSLPLSIAFPHQQATVQDISHHFRITPDVVGGFDFTLSERNNTLTIGHVKNFAYDTQYTITIDKDLPLGEGKTLGEDFTFHFHTRPRTATQPLYMSSYQWFQAYSVNAYDQTYEVPLSFGGMNKGTYTFSVYKSDSESFLDAYFATLRRWDGGEAEQNAKHAMQPKGAVIDEQTIAMTDDSFTYVPRITEPGMYLVIISSQNMSQSATKNNVEANIPFFLNITTQAAAVERLGNDVAIWVVDQKTGQGIEGVDVITKLERTKDHAVQKTDRTGVVRLSVPQSETEKPEMVIAKRGSDVAITALQTGWFGGFYSGDWGNQINPYQGYAYTDRPIYKPGDEVFFKVIARAYDRGLYTPKPVTMKIKAQEMTWGNPSITLFEQDMTANANGAVSDGFRLSKELKTGTYVLTAAIDGVTIASAPFNVEYYQKPDFEVQVATNAESYIKGDKATVNVSAHYYFGEPVKNQPVKIRAFESYYGTPFIETEAITDANGNATATFTMSQDGQYYYDWYGSGTPLTIEAAITDASGRTSSGNHTVTSYSSEYRLELKDEQSLWGLKAGEKQPITVVVKNNRTNEPQSGVALTGVLSDNDYYYYQGTPADPEQQFTATSDVLGEATFDITMSSGGSYLLRLTGKDPVGNELARNIYLWASPSGNEIGKPTIYQSRVWVTFDKPTYKIGERAVATVQVPRPAGGVLWSVNGKEFSRLETGTLRGETYTIEFPVTEQMAPGIYLSVLVFNDDQFSDARQYVDVTGKQLTVTVTPDRKIAGPKEDMTLSIKTVNAEGKGVAAESSLSVVDKAIFALKSDQVGSIYDAFYTKPDDWLRLRYSLEPITISGAEGGGCFLPDTKILMADGTLKLIQDIRVGDEILTRVSPTEPQLVRDTVKQTFKHLVSEYLVINGTFRVTPVHRILINGEWKQVGEAQIGDWFMDANGQKVLIKTIETMEREPVTVYNFETAQTHTYIADGIYVHNDKGGSDGARSQFVDTAFWNAFISTDANGEGKVSLVLPDNLTTWVAQAKSMTKATEAGQAIGEFTTTKPLIIRPVLPQFVRSGDKITILAAIHNGNVTAGTFRTLLTAEGATVVDESIRSVKLEGNSDTTVRWQLAIPESKTVKLRFRVEGPTGYTDTVEQTLPVYSPLNLQKEAQSTVGNSSIAFAMPTDVSPTYSKATVTIAPSVLASLPDLMKDLRGYPYGCVEQTMTKQLPNILTMAYRTVLGIAPESDSAEQLESGFDRLAKFQHEDGGFGWWENDENNTYMSGYVLEGLWEAKQAGLLTGREVTLDRLQAYLTSVRMSLPDSERMYITYVLSKVAPGSTTDDAKLFGNKILTGGAIDVQSKGYIALALYHNGEKEMAKRVLVERILPEMQDNHWEVPQQEDWHGNISDRYIATGVNLLALTTIMPEDQTAQRVVGWLMANRNGYEGLWGSTRQSAQILMGLISYLKESKELSPDFTYAVMLNGQQIKTGQMKDARGTVTIDLPISSLTAQNRLEFTQSGKGNLYASLLVHAYVPGGEVKSHGLTLTRSYLDMAGNPITSFTRGQMVRVRLTVTNPNMAQYLMVEDYLPAGMEPLNERLDNTQKDRRTYDQRGEWYESIDIRDQRVSLFQTYLWQGTHNYEYLARVGYQGSFTAPAPYAELMYSPEVFAIGSSNRIDVK